MSKNENTLHVSMKSKSKGNKPEYLSLLKNRKSLEFEDKKLHRAVVTNNTETVRELLQQGANPNSSDHLMRSPLHLASSRGFKEIVSLLLKFGADPNQKDIIGNTALHLAACVNKIELVTLLLDAGTDVSAIDQHGRSPLQLAQGKLKLLQYNCREGTVEYVNLRYQLQQIINLMLSFLRRKENDVEHFEKIRKNLDTSSDCQLDDQLTLLLNAIQDISLK